MADRLSAARLSHREAAKLIGLGHATISRICKGKAPSIDAYVRIEAWLANSMADKSNA